MNAFRAFITNVVLFTAPVSAVVGAENTAFFFELAAVRRFPDKSLRGAIVTPDGKQFIAYGFELVLHDLQSGRCLWKNTAHSDDVVAVGLSSNGKRCISCSADGTVRVWEIESGKCLLTFGNHKAPVVAGAFFPNSTAVATGDADGRLLLWDSTTGKVIRSIQAHTRAISCLAVSPQGHYVATGGYDCVIKVWDTNQGRECCSFSGHTLLVTHLLFHRTKSIVFSSSLDASFRGWDYETKQSIFIHQVKQPIYCMDLLADTGLILACGDYSPNTGKWNGRIERWDIGQHKQLAVFPIDNSDVRSVSIVALTGSIIATARSSKTIYVLNAVLGK